MSAQDQTPGAGYEGGPPSPERARGKYDGTTVTYYFGKRHGHDNFKVNATSLRVATRMFRAGKLFPEQLAESSGEVTVHVSTKTGWEEVARIPARGEDIDPRALLLVDAVAPDMEGATGTTALAAAGEGTGIRTQGRTALEQKRADLDARLAALEVQKRAMEAVVSQIKAELTRRMEQVWLVELFIGSKEEVVVLREGAPAPADTMIHVRQRVLCMDEEIAVHDALKDPEKVDTFDITRVEDFDRWVSTNPAALKAICPWAKGVVGLRVRRRQRERESNNFAEAYDNATLASLDEMTCLLVRNGENLYRLWIDVNLWPRMFASEADSAALIDGHRGDQASVQQRLKHQIAGLIVVQGLVERSTLLHPLPREGLNIFDGSAADAFVTVRDDEEQLALGDGSPLTHVRWKDTYRYVPDEADTARFGRPMTKPELASEGYATWLQKQIAPGVRVLYTGRSYDGKDWDEKLESRTNVKSLRAWPKSGGVYTLTEYEKGRGVFLYLPLDGINGYDDEGDWGCRPRQRRVAFITRDYELVPVDFLSWRVLEHLIRDRSQRADYGDFFKIAFTYWRIAKKEAAHERPFIDLVLNRCGVDQDNEPERARCERLLRWWKLKVKEHRTLSTDDAKAMRMIEAAFLRGEDHDNDPETLLFKRT